MPWFRLEAKVTVTASTKIQADTLEEAIKASESRSVALESEGSSHLETWIIEEADGFAQDIGRAE